MLARLDDSDARRRHDAIRAARDVARASLDEIEVSLADAERTLRRTVELSQQGVSSQQNLDSATAAVDGLRARLEVARRSLAAAEAELAVAQQDLENYTVRAPFAGIVVSKDAQPGEMVSPVSAGGGFTRTGIATIVDMASLEIEVDVNESYIAKVSPGQPVDAVLDAYPDWHIPATVRTVIPTADRQKATVKVRLTFDALDPAHPARHGGQGGVPGGGCREPRARRRRRASCRPRPCAATATARSCSSSRATASSAGR